MKRFLITLTSLFCFSFIAFSQQEEDSVKAVINQLFTGMSGANLQQIKETFADSAFLQTIRRKRDGSFFVHNEKINDFVAFISQVKKDSADERITYGSIRIDGPLASVWTPYKFYYAGKFSHCGVNSFQLVKINGRWKIQYLIDTRRTEGCE